MKRPLPALDVDLLIEHDGRHLELRGSEMRFVARFPTLASLFHFLRIFWPYRNRAPLEATLEIEWWRLCIPVKTSALDRRP
jgi:hypothetical protein